MRVYRCDREGHFHAVSVPADRPTRKRPGVARISSRPLAGWRAGVALAWRGVRGHQFRGDQRRRRLRRLRRGGADLSGLARPARRVSEATISPARSRASAPATETEGQSGAGWHEVAERCLASVRFGESGCFSRFASVSSSSTEAHLQVTGCCGRVIHGRQGGAEVRRTSRQSTRSAPPARLFSGRHRDKHSPPPSPPICSLSPPSAVAE